MSKRLTVFSIRRGSTTKSKVYIHWSSPQSPPSISLSILHWWPSTYHIRHCVTSEEILIILESITVNKVLVKTRFFNIVVYQSLAMPFRSTVMCDADTSRNPTKMYGKSHLSWEWATILPTSVKLDWESNVWSVYAPDCFTNIHFITSTTWSWSKVFT